MKLDSLPETPVKLCQVILCTSPVKENLEHILAETGFSCPSKIFRLGTYFPYFYSTCCDIFKPSLNAFESPGLCSDFFLFFPYSENPSQGLIVETRDRGAEKELKTQSMKAPLTISTHVEAGLFARRVSTLPKLLPFTVISMCSFHRKRCLVIRSKNPTTGV